ASLLSPPVAHSTSPTVAPATSTMTAARATHQPQRPPLPVGSGTGGGEGGGGGGGAELRSAAVGGAHWEPSEAGFTPAVYPSAPQNAMVRRNHPVTGRGQTRCRTELAPAFRPLWVMCPAAAGGAIVRV